MTDRTKQPSTESITAQKQASQYARGLIEASLDPLVTISPEGKITDVNQATIKVTGVRREVIIRTDFSDYLPEPKHAREGYQQASRNDSFRTTDGRFDTCRDRSSTFSTTPASTRMRHNPSR